MRLLTIMERHIRDGLHLQLQCSADQVRNIFCATNIILWTHLALVPAL